MATVRTIQADNLKRRVIFNGESYTFEPNEENLDGLVSGERAFPKTSKFDLRAQHVPFGDYGILLAMTAFLENDMEPNFPLYNVILEATYPYMRNQREIVSNKSDLMQTVNTKISKEIKEKPEYENEIMIEHLLKLMQKTYDMYKTNL